MPWEPPSFAFWVFLELKWCGASHGWLVASDELSNLVLYHPFNFATIPLPPITDLECVKGVYDSDGSIVGYRYGKRHEYEPNQPGAQGLGTWFYQKVVLSCNPSRGGDYTAVAIHYYDGNWISFTRARESRWRLAAAPADRSDDRYADCVYHDGRFYTVTLHGVLEAWDLCGPQEPSKEVIINGDRRYRGIHTRFLVSTPCGGLLQIRTLERIRRPGKIEVEVLQVDVQECKLVSLSSSTALRDHAVFVGLNHSACLPVREFPELRPNCVYFTTPRLIHHDNFGLPGWRGVGIYDLENHTFEYVFPSFGPDYGGLWPSELWYVPNR
ncbi:uncharacterized protein [Aegilops tauschii subsp. strangulata]|uniref:uncharacterized protein n=1 Tax=Aegilops tauschii subsp. strangulata TaxID=200361 RepID=UPI00098B6DB4|nr:uncharacterized protein LOC109735909 [Aegilops tauschii subsp. strangulata]